MVVSPLNIEYAPVFSRCNGGACSLPDKILNLWISLYGGLTINGPVAGSDGHLNILSNNDSWLKE